MADELFDEPHYLQADHDWLSVPSVSDEDTSDSNNICDTSRSHAPIEDIGELFHFVDLSCCTSIVANFHQQRLNGQFLDVTLKAGKTTIVAHRSFLAAFAEYFEGLFTSGMLESTMKEIELKEIDGATLSFLIDFAYSGEIYITSGNVSSILEMANYLGVEVVKNACCRYLWKHINFVNAFDVMLLASRFGCVKLLDQVKCYLVERFHLLSTSSAFVDLNDEVLYDLVSDNRLVFMEEEFCVSASRQEQLVLESVLLYVKHDVSSRIGLLNKFLSTAVRLPLIPHEMLRDTRQNLAEFPQLTAALDAAMSQMPERDAVSFRTRGLQHFCDVRLADDFRVHAEQVTQVYDDSQEPVTDARYVTGMTVYIRIWYEHPVFGGLKIQYNSGQVVQVGGDSFPSGSCHEFRLEQNERIVRAVVRSGWMVDQLTFYTNRDRQFGPYGSLGGEQHIFHNATRPSYLAGIKCRVEYSEFLPSIRRFSLVWGRFTYSD